MKFEYDRKERTDDCVAFIDSDGDLVIVDRDGDAIAFGVECVHPSYELSDSTYIAHKFYPGDKITITF